MCTILDFQLLGCISPMSENTCFSESLILEKKQSEQSAEWAGRTNSAITISKHTLFFGTLSYFFCSSKYCRLKV